MQATTVFRTAKSWVANQEPLLVWQVTPWINGEKTADKTFLRVDARQQTFGLALTSEKPEGLTADAALINQMRKHVPTGTITQVWEDPARGDLWLDLYTAAGDQGGAYWYLKLARSRPPEMCLMNREGLIYVTHGARGTFTKKRPHEGPMPHQEPSHFRQVATSLWQDFQGTAPEAEPSHPAVPEAASSTETAISLSPEDRILAQRLRRRLKTLRKARARQAGLIPDTTAIAQRETQARWLQKFLYQVREGDFSLRLTPESTDLADDLDIPLDPEMSPGRNLENHFSQVKKLKKAVEMGTRELQKIDRDLAQTEEALARLQQGERDISSLAGFHPAPQPSGSRHEAPVARPYRAFLSSEGVRLLVGKGAAENDELTKSAKGNDYWFHAVGVTGSHVIIPIVREIRESLPARTMREAAILALHYSKLKSNLAGEVYVARRGDLRKQKGMPKGLWTILRSDTFFIRYTQDEADLVLGRPSS